MAADALLVGRTSSASSPIVTASGTTTTGSTFVVAISCGAAATISAVTDSKGNTYTIIGSVQTDSGGNHRKALYRCNNGTGGAGHTASVTFTGSGIDGTVHLIELTGVTTSSFDQTAQGNDSASPYGVTLPTLSQADEIIITIIGGNGGTGGAATSSSNTTTVSEELNDTAYWHSCVTKAVVASTAAFTPSFTMAGGPWDTALVSASFRAATVTTATLSSASPSGTIGTTTTATLGATTDQTTGTLYGVIDSAANLSGVTASQIKAGQRASGASALSAGNSAVSTVAPQISSLAGLSAATLYSYALVQNNANGDSNVLTGTFTTAAAATNPGRRLYGVQGSLRTIIGL